jgi:hypothetical protein
MGKCCHGHDPKFTRVPTKCSHSLEVHLRGRNVSPRLAWEGVPDGAKSLVLIIDDPDAPDPKAPKMVWVHWVVYHAARYQEGVFLSHLCCNVSLALSRASAAMGAEHLIEDDSGTVTYRLKDERFGLSPK